MSNAAEALKKALEHEKLALERYKEAINCSTHPETKETLKKLASEKNQQIDSLHWMVLAEAGQLETQDASETSEGEAPAKAASKCPFSGALAEMGIDITKMGEMSKEDFAKMESKTGVDMAKMMEMRHSEEKSDS